MGVNAIAAAFAVRGLTSSQKLVLLAYADCANDDGECWPGTSRIAEKCELSLRSVETRTTELCEMGHMRRQYTFVPNGAQSKTHYHLTIPGLPVPVELRKSRRQMSGKTAAPPAEDCGVPPAEDCAGGGAKVGQKSAGGPRRNAQGSNDNDEPSIETSEPSIVSLSLGTLTEDDVDPERENADTRVARQQIEEWVRAAERLCGINLSGGMLAQARRYADKCRGAYPGFAANAILDLVFQSSPPGGRAWLPVQLLQCSANPMGGRGEALREMKRRETSRQRTDERAKAQEAAIADDTPLPLETQARLRLIVDRHICNATPEEITAMMEELAGGSASNLNPQSSNLVAVGATTETQRHREGQPAGVGNGR